MENLKFKRLTSRYITIARYRTQEEWLSDVSPILHKGDPLIPKLQKLADKVLKIGYSKSKEIGNSGIASERAWFKKLFQSEKQMLNKWRRSTVSWIDENNVMYCINYRPAEHIGEPDRILVSREYFISEEEEQKLEIEEY